MLKDIKWKWLLKCMLYSTLGVSVGLGLFIGFVVLVNSYPIVGISLLPIVIIALFTQICYQEKVRAERWKQ